MATRIEASELRDEIRKALAGAAVGKGTEPGFLTAYQILNRLPVELRERLEALHGTSGKHGGQPYGAATRVAQVAAKLPRVDKAYLDTKDLQFNVGQAGDVEAGYMLCALFRLVDPNAGTQLRSSLCGIST